MVLCVQEPSGRALCRRCQTVQDLQHQGLFWLHFIRHVLEDSFVRTCSYGELFLLSGLRLNNKYYVWQHNYFCDLPLIVLKALGFSIEDQMYKGQKKPPKSQCEVTVSYMQL